MKGLTFRFDKDALEKAAVMAAFAGAIAALTAFQSAIPNLGLDPVFTPFLALAVSTAIATLSKAESAK